MAADFWRKGKTISAIVFAFCDLCAIKFAEKTHFTSLPSEQSTEEWLNNYVGAEVNAGRVQN